MIVITTMISRYQLLVLRVVSEK